MNSDILNLPQSQFVPQALSDNYKKHIDELSTANRDSISNTEGRVVHVLWGLFVIAYNALKNSDSSPEIEQFIQESVKRLRRFLELFMKSGDINIPKIHAIDELCFQRLMNGPCRWWETSAKEAKHKFS